MNSGHTGRRVRREDGYDSLTEVSNRRICRLGD